MNRVSHVKYKSRTYEELSREFKDLYPTALRAFQLIPLMYNRLTLVDNLAHKAALKKIYDDHKDLPGFSSRNIQRYLPANNPKIPHRVVPPRHKSSHTESIGSNKISSTKLSSQHEEIPDEEIPEAKIRDVQPTRESSEVECRRCILLTTKNQELEQALLASSGCTRANNLNGSQIAYQIPKEKMYLVTEALEKSDKLCVVTFDNSGNFVYAEADNQRMKQPVLDNGKK